jgi:hypothetical protein
VCSFWYGADAYLHLNRLGNVQEPLRDLQLVAALLQLLP